MTETAISPLRRRMIEDMSVRNFVEKTQADYIRHVWTFTAFLGRSPDTAAPEDLRRFQLHQSETGVRPPTMNGSLAAPRYFFTITLGRAELARHLTFVREPRKIPVVMSPEEVARLLEAAPPEVVRDLALGQAMPARRPAISPCARCRRTTESPTPLWPPSPAPARQPQQWCCLRVAALAELGRGGRIAAAAGRRGPSRDRSRCRLRRSRPAPGNPPWPDTRSIAACRAQDLRTTIGTVGARLELD